MQLSHTLKFWLPVALVSTAVVTLVYAAVQQNYRLSANDPQIQMARDAAGAWDSGTDPDNLVSGNMVDMEKSLAPYLVVYDDNHTVLSTSGTLGGHTPAPPAGVFEYTKAHTEDRITWQPQGTVRQAAVIVKAKHGFVLAARNLQEVEARENQLLLICAVTLGTILLVTLGLAAVIRK